MHRYISKYGPRTLRWAITAGGGVWFGAQHGDFINALVPEVSSQKVIQRTISAKEYNAAQLHALVDLYYGETINIPN